MFNRQGRQNMLTSIQESKLDIIDGALSNLGLSDYCLQVNTDRWTINIYEKNKPVFMFEYMNMNDFNRALTRLVLFLDSLIIADYIIDKKKGFSDFINSVMTNF